MDLSDYRLPARTTRVLGKGTRHFCRRKREPRSCCHIPEMRQLPKHCRFGGKLLPNDRGDKRRSDMSRRGRFLRAFLAGALIQENGVFMSHKLFSAILIACSLLAFPVLAQDAAAPPAPASNNTNALTPDQARRALETLQDDTKRAQMIDTLRAIATAAPQPQPQTAPPEPKPAIPLEADSLGAQLLLTVSEQVGE